MMSSNDLKTNQNQRPSLFCVSCPWNFDRLEVLFLQSNIFGQVAVFVLYSVGFIRHGSRNYLFYLLGFPVESILSIKEKGRHKSCYLERIQDGMAVICPLKL